MKMISMQCNDNFWFELILLQCYGGDEFTMLYFSETGLMIELNYYSCMSFLRLECIT